MQWQSAPTPVGATQNLGGRNTMVHGHDLPRQGKAGIWRLAVALALVAALQLVLILAPSGSVGAAPAPRGGSTGTPQPLGTVQAWGEDVKGQLGDGANAGEPDCDAGGCNPTPQPVL